jgi:hypothetical protein
LQEEYENEYENEKKDIFSVAGAMYVPDALAGDGYRRTDDDVVCNRDWGRK